jgi:hypothetical protein
MQRKVTQPGRAEAEGEEMMKSARTAEFSKREIGFFILAMIAATVVTVEGTYYILKTFVVGNPNDPLTKAGGLSSQQEREVRKGK